MLKYYEQRKNIIKFAPSPPTLEFGHRTSAELTLRSPMTTTVWGTNRPSGGSIWLGPWNFQSHRMSWTVGLPPTTQTV